MNQSVLVEGAKTFLNGEAARIEAHRRVKAKSGSTTYPCEVVYADAGEDAIGITLDYADSGDQVAVMPLTKTGTFWGEAADTFSRLATLYGAADGKVSDTASGTPFFIALDAATAAGDIVEMILNPVLSTTGATVSIADAGSFTSETTVEGALQEIYQHLVSAQNFIPMPLTGWRESDGTNIPALASHGGILCQDSTPVLDLTNGDTDSALRLLWAATNQDAIICQVPLPPAINVGADLVVHFRAAMESTNDTPTMASDAYFNEGDTKVDDVSAAITGTAYAEYTITIANADIPAGAQTVTIELTPGSHGTDDLYVTAIWGEATFSILAS